MSDEAVYRTAPATPGLLNRLCHSGKKNFLNPKGHQNPISGSKVTVILLKGWIFPIGGASAGEGLRLKPAQQACFK